MLNSLSIRIKLNGITEIVSKQCFQFLLHLKISYFIFCPFYLQYFGLYWCHLWSWPSNWISIRIPLFYSWHLFLPSLQYCLIEISISLMVLVSPIISWVSCLCKMFCRLPLLISVSLIPSHCLRKAFWAPAFPGWNVKPESAKMLTGPLTTTHYTSVLYNFYVWRMSPSH